MRVLTHTPRHAPPLGRGRVFPRPERTRRRQLQAVQQANARLLVLIRHPVRPPFSDRGAF